MYVAIHYFSLTHGHANFAIDFVNFLTCYNPQYANGVCANFIFMPMVYVCASLRPFLEVSLVHIEFYPFANVHRTNILCIHLLMYM